MTNSSIPIYTQEFNPSSSLSSDRIHELIKTFQDSYGHQPNLIGRAPGRVNIIGEHIDYCGFSVLPAAVELDIILMASVDYHPISNSSQSPKQSALPITVCLSNTNQNYPSHQFSFESPDSIPLCHQGGWVNFVKASLKTVLLNITTPKQIPQNIQILFDANLPSCSGLSSSAALTTVSTLIFYYIFNNSGNCSNEPIQKDKVVRFAIESERSNGISVGGMDQTASVYGEIGKLLHIEFIPETKVIPLPFPKKPSTTFIISNSLKKSTKLESSKTQYNLRFIESKIGTRMLLRSDELLRLLSSSSSSSSTKNKYKLKEMDTLKELIDQIQSENIMKSIDQVLELIEGKVIVGDENGFTIEQVMKRLGFDDDDFKAFDDQITNGLVVEPVDGKFMIYNRLKHILSEAKRVYEFNSLISSSSSSSLKEEEEEEEETMMMMIKIGKLMNDSHLSCDSDYDCSSDELNQLIQIAIQNGSLGSRLTGAGWGGCCIHLVPDQKVENVLKSLYQSYYQIQFPKMDLESFNQICFTTKPSEGACLFLNKEQFI
ncbi:hypothetical protein CROQUDRAFT_83306 [Cronartium quercuum f. sp. fusiforme G11]|uniref:Galactokinase n=1 Tax=Cronartium quercuum f. sp. fusiforme G11 TaxID=708437 RepID=A0A9P6N998_9BASI|nr:hypothetical protein CROQUDRAFT_83306 [Cronartium quercuum f. sp. fusiforme G11]